MPTVEASYHPPGLIFYIANMTYAADVKHGNFKCELGAVSTADANGILNDASATDAATAFDTSDFETTYTAGMGSTYGRATYATGTAGSNHVVTVTGYDWWGQKMQENITLNGTTPVYGKKAFYHITNVSVAAGAAGDTFDLGWWDCLGLKYTAVNILGEYMDEAVVARAGSRSVCTVPFLYDATAYAAGTGIPVISPVKGDVTGIAATTQTLPNGAGAVTVNIGSGGTAVTGLALTIGDSTTGTVGTVYTDTTTIGTTTSVAKNGVIEVKVDSVPSAGALTGYVAITPNNLLIGYDGTQTATTNDPRGTYTLETAANGTRTFAVTYYVNQTNLCGDAHYTA